MGMPPVAQPATLSLCLIVRNGERSLGPALASARPFVDEMIVVDTGSTDGTRQIARANGAVLREFAWCDDFSAARNFSIEQATGDWIFWMDADDVLPAGSGQKLRQVISQHPQRNTAFWVTVEETITSPSGRPPRVVGHAHAKLFPRHPAIRFKYRVHEQVAPAIRELGLPIRHSDAVVQHAHADRSPLGETARGKRNLRLALLDLQERPDDPFVWLSLGTIYLFLPSGLKDALHFLRRSVAGLRRGSQNQLNACLYLGQALHASGDCAEEEQVYRRALELFPHDSGLLLRLAGLCEKAGRPSEAADWYETVLKRGQVRSASVHVRGSAAQAALRLGKLYARTGQSPRAEQLWREFLERNPHALEIREALSASQVSERMSRR